MIEDLKYYLERDDRFPWVTFIIVLVLYVVCAYWRTGADNASLWYVFSFFEESEMSYDWMAIWITLLFFIGVGIRMGFLAIASTYDEEAEVSGYKLFQIVLLASFIAFIVDSMLVAGIDNHSTFMSQVIRRFITTGILTGSIYIGYSGNDYMYENKTLLLPCFMLGLFQMIFDVAWTVSTVIE